MRVSAVFKAVVMLTLILALLLNSVPARAVDRQPFDDVWEWFTGQVRAGPCLTRPNLIVTPDLGQGAYTASYSGGDIRVSAGAPVWTVVHEFAHHYDTVCRISARPVGRSFAYRTGSDMALWWAHPEYTERPSEMFAATMTWMLTGWGSSGPTRFDRYAWTPIARRLLVDWDAGHRGEEFKALFGYAARFG